MQPDEHQSSKFDKNKRAKINLEKCSNISSAPASSGSSKTSLSVDKKSNCVTSGPLKQKTIGNVQVAPRYEVVAQDGKRIK